MRSTLLSVDRVALTVKSKLVCPTEKAGAKSWTFMRQMPIADDFDIAWVLDNTYGFVGADLAALVREAAMRALRRYLPEIDLDEETLPPEVLEKMEVCMDDFKEAIRDIEPSALREIYVEVPEVGWDEVGASGSQRPTQGIGGMAAYQA